MRIAQYAFCSVVARDLERRKDEQASRTQRSFRAEKLLYDAVIMDICHYTVVTIYRMDTAKTKP